MNLAHSILTSFSHLPLFALYVFCAYFCTGFFFIKRLKGLSLFEQFVASNALGMCLYSVGIYFFGYIGLFRSIYLPIGLLLVICISIRRDLLHFFLTLFQGRKKWLPILIFLCIGTSIQCVQMFGSGVQTSTGMPFFRVHAQDGIFHLAMISGMTRQFPPIEPGVVGIPVQNYHYWSDMLIAHSALVTNIPIHTLFFQYYPVFISLSTALAVVALTRRLAFVFGMRDTRAFVFFSLFFLYCGSDLAYLFMLKNHGIWGFYTSAIDNGATQFLNMPHTFAKLIFSVALLLYLHWREKKEWQLGLIVALLASVLFGLKIYFALLFGVFFAVEVVLECISVLCRKTTIRSFFAFVLVGIAIVLFALPIYLPPNSGSGGLGWYPLEWVKLMISRENLDLTNFSQKWAVAQYYGMYWKVVGYQTVAIVITLLAIHGTRLLGFFSILHGKTNQGKKLIASLTVTCAFFTFLGMTTLQKSGSFNVFNFFTSSLFLFGLLSAYTFAVWWNSKNLVFRIIVCSLVVLTMPRIVFETHKILLSYRDDTDVVWISDTEQQALTLIQKTSDRNALVLVSPQNMLDYNTPYVSYFANRFTYASGQSVLLTHNQRGVDRGEELKAVWYHKSATDMHTWFVQKKIDFVYTAGDEVLPFDAKKAGLTSIFKNGKSHIYRVEKNI